MNIDSFKLANYLNVIKALIFNYNIYSMPKIIYAALVLVESNGYFKSSKKENDLLDQWFKMFHVTYSSNADKLIYAFTIIDILSESGEIVVRDNGTILPQINSKIEKNENFVFSSIFQKIADILIKLTDESFIKEVVENV